LLTCAHLKREGVTIAGVILNDDEGKKDLAARTNPEMLARYLDVPLLGLFPHLETAPRGLPDRTLLADIVEKHVDTRPLFDG
jgi:dethiobiotin synthetase